MQLNPIQEEILRKAVAPCDPEIFIEHILASGFDKEIYLSKNIDLVQNKLDSLEAFFHFLEWGYKENRAIPVGKIGDGIRDLLSLPINNKTYLQDVTRALFRSQLAKKENHAAFWDGIKQEHIDLVREIGCLPYFVVGDSHANLYCPSKTEGWSTIAPFLLICSGGSARGLSNPQSKSKYGLQILNWANATSVQLKKDPRIPVFLKFGQVDVEFVWILRRIKLGILGFSELDFDDFATQVVQSYGTFLLALRRHFDPSALRICSIFPPVLSDASWARGYMNAHIGFLESDQALDDLSREVQKLEIPDIATRTKLHARFNIQLKNFCSNSDFTFVDDFSPMLGPNNIADPRFYEEQTEADHHLSPGPTSGIIESIIWKGIQLAN